MKRRKFLGASAGAVGAAWFGSPLASGCGSSSGSNVGESTMNVTMWEFSWLVRRQGAEAEYADWDKVLEELAERGYDTIRIDAFPHLVAHDSEAFTILPQNPLFMWGNHEPVTVEPGAALVEFISKVRARGMGVGLSTWFNDDELHLAETVETPADYARIWRATLDLLGDANLLDAVRWVDLCNEFPIFRWARGAYPLIYPDRDPNDPLAIVAPWTDDELARIQTYLDDGIGPLRDAYPELKYTFSLDAYGAESSQKLDTSAFDLAEPHIWLSTDLGFASSSGQLALLLAAEDPEPDLNVLQAHAQEAPEVYFGQREQWLGLLEGMLDSWADWAAERELPLVTSEAWGPINYDDTDSIDGVVDTVPGTSEWDWVKDIGAEGVRMAVERGWAGICTSNFAQPHFVGMWSDVTWHRDLNSQIKG